MTSNSDKLLRRASIDMRRAADGDEFSQEDLRSLKFVGEMRSGSPRIGDFIGWSSVLSAFAIIMMTSVVCASFYAGSVYTARQSVECVTVHFEQEGVLGAPVGEHVLGLSLGASVGEDAVEVPVGLLLGAPAGSNEYITLHLEHEDVAGGVATEKVEDSHLSVALDESHPLDEDLSDRRGLHQLTDSGSVDCIKSGCGAGARERRIKKCVKACLDGVLLGTRAETCVTTLLEECF